MLSENQISIYKKDGLVKSSTCLSDDKVKDLLPDGIYIDLVNKIQKTYNSF